MVRTAATGARHRGDVILRRVAAIRIGVILPGIVTLIIGFPLVDTRVAALGSLVGLPISFAYYIYPEGNYGQTLGKMALDLVVVTVDGEPADYEAATIRTVMQVIDVLPVLYLFGFVLVLVTDRKQRLGDLAADTVVRIRTNGGH